MPHKPLIILGTRGIPNQYGGFETFVEKFAPFMAERGWPITVYCQADNLQKMIAQDQWQGVTRVHITPRISKKLIDGAYGTILFDCLAVLHALFYYRKAVWMTMGYNTATLNILPRLFRIKQIINMDGMEWQRDKWSKFRKAYLYQSYFIAGDAATVLIADHPEIEKELRRDFKNKKIEMIAYGSPEVLTADNNLLQDFSVEKDGYCLIIARPVPENGLLQIIRTWSKTRGAMKLIVVGKYDEAEPYQKEILSYASENIVFTGAIYDRKILDALRLNCYGYFHGYTVGGTNPSLVEALATGAGIIAHDNRFNRWVAGEAGVYYKDEAELDQIVRTIKSKTLPIDTMRINARLRHQEAFKWQPILEAYEQVVKSCC